MLAAISDAHVKDMRWAVCGSSSWSPKQEVTSDMKFKIHEGHFQNHQPEPILTSLQIQNRKLLNKCSLCRESFLVESRSLGEHNVSNHFGLVFTHCHLCFEFFTSQLGCGLSELGQVIYARLFIWHYMIQIQCTCVLILSPFSLIWVFFSPKWCDSYIGNWMSIVIG